jgi:signal transduction histidine kinase/ligand-binding sensor domain-containing protein
MKNLFTNKLGIFISVMVLTFPVFGLQVVFNKLIPPTGSDFSSIIGFTQDKNGSIWISTTDGVYSYDGIQFTTLKTNPINPNSLAKNFTHSVCADNKGMIWIGTFGNGLDMFNPETGNFTHFLNDPNNPASLVNDTVTVVLIDKNGTLWIGTHGGLDKFDSETNTFVHYQYDANDSTSLSNNQVRVIYEDREGILWIGTGSPYPHDGGGPDAGGLNKLNKETGTFTRYMHDPNNKNSLLNNKVSAVFEDINGTLWIGSWKKGIQKLDREKGTFELAFSESEINKVHNQQNLSNRGLTDDFISFITQDVTGKIWFATLASGIYSFDPETRKTTFYYGAENSYSGFSDYGARSAFNTRDGIFWIGTQGGDIYYMDPSVREIKHTSINGASVSSFYEEANGDFWIGTRNEIFRIIKNIGVTKRFTTDDYIYDAPYNLGYLVYGDLEGNIWVGTTESLNRFDKKTEKFIAYKNDPNNNNSLSNNYAITIFEDSKSNFWVGTANGLNLMNRKTGLFSRFYAHPEDTVNQNVITCITEDKSGKLWIGNFFGMGVNRFNTENKEFKNYLKGTSVIILYIDTDAVLWAGAANGLYKYNPDIDNFIQFTPNGSTTNILEVNSIVEDNQKNLWLITSNQIVRINPERDEISFFGQNYGVGQSLFNYLSGIKRSNGEIYFGDQTGYFSFFPDEFIENSKAPEIVFTSLRLSDIKLNSGDGGPLKEDLNVQKEIKFRYNQNVFSIDFAIIDYANPKQNRLSYFLENYDISWRNTISDRRAYYFNVPPGKYTFRVKGVNSYGVWAEKKLDIIIFPPWYRTWFAYAIYALLFIAAVFGMYRFQRARLLQKEKERNRERELEHAHEIEAAYNNLEVAHENLKSTQTQLIQSEKMASLGQLTAGIAHEIQNPLNFVNNFSEVSNELIEELKSEKAKGKSERDEEMENEILNDISQNLEKILHHGKRADAIVKGMLQHSRSNSGHKEPTDINSLADEYLRLSYHGMRAKDKSFNAEYKTEFEPNLPKINVVPQDIGRVLLNLINNAFYAVTAPPPPGGGIKNSQTDYKPTVIVSTTSSKSPSGDLGVKIIVKDNGPGINKNIVDKIFQPFFTTKPTGQGTGLGLSLAYDIVKAHGGEIRVETKEGEARPDDTVGRGTEFIIEIPIKTN